MGRVQKSCFYHYNCLWVSNLVHIIVKFLLNSLNDNLSKYNSFFGLITAYFIVDLHKLCKIEHKIRIFKCSL